MSEVVIAHLEAHIGGRTLLRIRTARIEPRARIALIGPNGSGKSTLVGAIWEACGGTPAQVARSPVVVTAEIVVRPQLAAVHLRQEPDAAQARGRPAEDAATALETTRGRAAQPSAAVLARWGLAGGDPARRSAGQRTRAALAAALHADPDLLLLDEPTNHLDGDGLGVLEAGLRAARGAALIVSHDRAFLDEVATETWELRAGEGDAGAQLRVFPGNFSAYRRQAALEAESARRAFADHETRRAHLEAAARRQAEWTARAFAAAGPRDPHAQRLAKKMARRGRAFSARLERMGRDGPAKPWAANAVVLPVAGRAFAGRVVLTAEALEPAGVRCFCERLEVPPGARIALVGPNGSGKTTLLHTLAGERRPAAGRLWRSPAVALALVRQDRALPPGPIARPTAAEVLAAVPQVASARSTAALLGLRRDRADVPYPALSGGERTAVALAVALAAGANLLLLDEPTNHLDIAHREAVEAALAAFPGAVIAATHDRWLVARWATAVWRLEDGRLVTAGAADAAGGDPPVTDAADLARRMRLAELEARLADPHLAGQPEARAAIQAEIVRLVRPGPRR